MCKRIWKLPIIPFQFFQQYSQFFLIHHNVRVNHCNQQGNSTRELLGDSEKYGKITGLYGDWFSKEASYYWKSYDLVISVKRIEKLPRDERLYQG